MHAPDASDTKLVGARSRGLVPTKDKSLKSRAEETGHGLYLRRRRGASALNLATPYQPPASPPRDYNKEFLDPATSPARRSISPRPSGLKLRRRAGRAGSSAAGGT